MHFIRATIFTIFIILLILITIFLPVICYFWGLSGTEHSKIFIFVLSFLILWGWLMYIRKLITDISTKTFDLGLAWDQYIYSEHFIQKGSKKNKQLYRDGYDLITRAYILLLDFYKDNNYSLDGRMHGESVHQILNEEYRKKYESILSNVDQNSKNDIGADTHV